MWENLPQIAVCGTAGGLGFGNWGFAFLGSRCDYKARQQPESPNPKPAS